MANLKKLVGRSLERVYIDPSDNTRLLVLTDQGPITYIAEGDCCSHSWFESLDHPERLENAKVLKVEENITFDDGKPRPEEQREYECLQYYGVRVTTEKGEAVIEYRNSSNGYYGGYLVEEGRSSWEDD